MSKPIVKLSDVEVRDGAYFHLAGLPTGHPRLRDGERIYTSEILGVQDGGIVETRNTLYVVGDEVAGKVADRIAARRGL